MYFGFALDLSGRDFWNIDLLDTHLNLLSPDKYTDIPSKYFVCLQIIFRTSSRHVFKTSSRHVFKTSSTHIFKTSSRHAFKTSSRHLQDFLQDVFETSLQDVFKTSSKSLQDVLEDVKLLRWRRVEDVFKTANVYWERTLEQVQSQFHKKISVFDTIVDLLTIPSPVRGKDGFKIFL